VELDLSIADVREELRKLGIETNATDSMSFLLDIYDAKKDNPIYCQTTINNNVTLPKESTDYLPELEEKHKVLSFEFQHGASFIVDERLSIIQIIKFLEIIASLVTIKKKDDTENQRNNRFVSDDKKER
jgi:hypothetical protein